jgi:hypothetical protein
MIGPEPVSKPTPITTAKNRRASPEAVAKRRAARAFNEVVLGPGPGPRAGDGRTERRRRRMLHELAQGATGSGHELKPIDVLLRVQALLDLGETVASISAARALPEPVKTTDALVEGVRRLHQAYAFAPEVYRFVGIGEAALVMAGVQGRKRGPVKASVRPSAGGARRGAA